MKHIMLSRLAPCILLWSMLAGCGDSSPDPIKVSFHNEGRVEMLEDLMPSTVADYGPGVFLSRPADEDLLVYFATSGTATINEDYTISNPTVIPKGSTFASVSLQYVDDKLDEYDETGDLRIMPFNNPLYVVDTVSGKFLIFDDDAADLQISVLWGTDGNPDMDVYLWRETSPGSNQFEVVSKQANHSFGSGVEGITLSGLDKDGLYAISYVYYSAAPRDSFPFRVILESVGGAIVEGGKTQLEFDPTYTQKNLNKGEVTLHEQYFTKKGFEFYNFSDITVPGSGS